MRHRLLLVTNANNQLYTRALLDFLPLIEFEPFELDALMYLNKPASWRRSFGVKLGKLVLTWLPQKFFQFLRGKLVGYLYLPLIEDLRRIQPAAVVTDDYLICLAVSGFIEQGLYRGKLAYCPNKLAVGWVVPPKNVSAFGAVTLQQSQTFQVLGVPSQNIVKVGPIVNKELFSAQSAITDDQRLALGLMSTFFKVLVFVDENNLDRSIETVKQLLRSSVSFQVLVVTGSSKFKDHLPSAPAHHPLKIFGLERLMELYPHANVFICNSQLHLIASALAVPIPVVVDGSSDNAELAELQKLRVVDISRNARETQFQVEQILAKNKLGQWQHAKSQLWPHGQPEFGKVLDLIKPQPAPLEVKNYQKT